MLLSERLRSIALGALVFVTITVEWKASCLGAAKFPRRTVYTMKGELAKLVYKPTTDFLASDAEKFGQWTKDNSTVVQTDNVVTGGNMNRKRFWLKIRTAHHNDSGRYSFKINGTIMRQWKLRVTDHPVRAWAPAPAEEPCGEPYEELTSSCAHFGLNPFPSCSSFPGPPVNMKIVSYLHQGLPVIEVAWDPPNNGFGDLWGYQLHIAPDLNHVCDQINSKDEMLHWQYTHGIKFNTHYRIAVQSLPSYDTNGDRNEVWKEIAIPDKCHFPEYKNLSECCPITNTTADYNGQQIHLKWAIPEEECKEFETFTIEWTNIQKPECHGQISVKGKNEYFIPLEKEECKRFNYSIKVYGKINTTETDTFKTIVSIPQKPIILTKQVPASDNSKKIMMVVFGTFLGVLIFTILVMYRVFFKRVRIQLPDPLPIRPHSDDPLLESDKKRVFIMHTRCCEKCSQVVHCFGAVLNSTDLIEASIDMWSTLDIAPNVPRWYEDQVKNSHCVVLLASHKMSLRCQNTGTVEEGDDPLNIKCQLNLVRGNIAQNPDEHKFIPAFFTCSGSKKNIPEFLSSRWSHKLPRDIDRVIFHLLNVEKIQPYRTQPIVVMGGNGHPFDERKKELERAVQEAEMYHKNNILQNV